MSSEQLADGVNPLDAELAATWDVLKGYSGRDTDLGIARRFGGSAAAYSLRDIGAMNGRVVKVRRDVDGDGTDKEEDFSANQVSSGALEDWVNGKLESTLPADVATAAAAYSLRKVKASYSGNAIRIRRSSDDIEVNVSFDSDNKVSASSAITNVAEQGGESGQTTATDINGFLNPTYTVGTSVGSATRPFDSFTSNGNDGFTATNNTTGSATAGFPYTFATGDVISVSFDLVIENSASPTFILSGNNMGSGSLGTGTTFTTSGSYTQELTTSSGTGTHLAFTDGNTGTFTVSNFRVTSHKAEAFVHTWYDQAGSNNAVQATAANQPKVAESGALLADGIEFDGSSSFLDATSALGATSTIGIFSVIKPDSTDNDGFILDNRDAVDDGTRLMQSDSGIGKYLFSMDTTDVSLADEGVSTTETLITAIQSSTAATLFRNAAQVATAADNPISVTSAYRIGSNRVTAGITFFDGTMKEIILFTSDQTDNRFKIESNINNYYGLYTFQGDGFVETWYDQSGNGNDATQGTAGNQPTIVQNGGLISDGIQFDGSADALNFTDLTLTDASIFTVLDIDGTENLQIILGGSTSTTTATMIPMMQTSSTTTQVYKNATVGGAEQGNSQFRNGSQITLNNRGDAYTELAAQDKMLFTMIDVDVAEAKVLDGISQTPSDATTWALKGTMEELIIYNSDLSSDRGTIESEIANHYNITLS